MRNLIMNKKEYVALNYKGKIAVADENNNKTGEYFISYGEEIPFKAHISGARGNAMVETNGVDLDYDKTIVLSKNLFDFLQFDENTVFFIDKKPEYDALNNPMYDYSVKRICDTINEVVIQIKKVRR